MSIISKIKSIFGAKAKKKPRAAAAAAAAADTILEAMIDGVQVADAQGRIIQANKALVEMRGYDSVDELLGTTRADAVPKRELPRVMEAMKECMKKGFIQNFETIAVRKDGSEYSTLLNATTLKDEKGKFVGIIATIRDITELKRLQEKEKKAAVEEEKRIFAEKLAKGLKVEVKKKTQKIKEAEQLRERFISDASHELRTPLAVLQTNLDLLNLTENSKNSFSHKDFKEFIESSRNQIRNLSTILEELTLLSRGKRLEELREEIDLKTIVQEVVEELKPLAEAKDIGCEVKILDQDIKLRGDEGMLRKLVRNLISNAIKYGKEKGKVEIFARKQDGEAELKIVDDGIGIRQKDLPFIFERFYRTDKGRSKEKGGTGLGLAICKWIAELHGGEIGAQSTHGKGSVFKLLLPLKGTWEDKGSYWAYKSRKRASK